MTLRPTRYLAQMLAIAGLLLVRPPSDVLGQDAPLRPRTIDQLVRSAVDSGFSGAVLVAIGDRVIWRSGYGLATPGSAFWIASITKSFTAVAVLQLVERQRVALADGIASFFPETPADKRAITVRQLLTHTAGFGASYPGGGVASRGEAVAAILAEPLARRPGAGYQYEDGSYELLAAIVEVVSGMRWETFVQRELLNPAGLTHTGFWCQAELGASAPIAGRSGVVRRCGARDQGTSLDDWGHRGANGMFSTVDDLLRWARALAHPRVFGFAGRLTLGTPQVSVRREGDFEISTGFGSRIYTRDGRITEVWLSGSGDEGHTAVVRMLASGATIIVLSNAGMRGDRTWSAIVAQRIAPRD